MESINYLLAKKPKTKPRKQTHTQQNPPNYQSDFTTMVNPHKQPVMEKHWGPEAWPRIYPSFATILQGFAQKRALQPAHGFQMGSHTRDTLEGP